MLGCCLRKGGRADLVAQGSIAKNGVGADEKQSCDGEGGRGLCVLEEIDLFGVRANRNTMEEVMPLIVAGRVRVQPLVTHTVLASTAYSLAYPRAPGHAVCMVKS